MLAITTQATKSYTYALEAQLPLMVAALRYAGIDEAVFILAGDHSEELKKAAKTIEKDLRDGTPKIRFEHLALNVGDNGNAKHQKSSNLVIAKLQAAAWHKARMMGADRLWNLEADILPNANTLQCMIDVLAFDHGRYDVAFCTYPNEDFVGGRGDDQHWIFPNVFDDERQATPEMHKRIKARGERKAALARNKEDPTAEDLKEWKELDDLVAKPPAMGNVWQLQSKHYRRRGWLTSAYPGVGLGAVVPSDWIVLGCTLMSRRALDLANFTGYDGGSTQDLWLARRVFRPMGMQFACIPHAVCSHVKQDRAEGREPALRIMYARHEMVDKECYGHLRSDQRPWDGL
jgi:hypothetical protein